MQCGHSGSFRPWGTSDARPLSQACSVCITAVSTPASRPSQVRATRSAGSTSSALDKLVKNCSAYGFPPVLENLPTYHAHALGLVPGTNNHHRQQSNDKNMNKCGRGHSTGNGSCLKQGFHPVWIWEKEKVTGTHRAPISDMTCTYISPIIVWIGGTLVLSTMLGTQPGST